MLERYFVKPSTVDRIPPLRRDHAANQTGRCRRMSTAR